MAEMEQPMIVPLVPNRECGACTACCQYLTINAPELKKLPGILCSNYKDCGCSIYATRPSICRSWHCAWRMFDHLGDEWRPDKCGFLVVPIAGDDLPAGYDSTIGFQFHLIGPTSSVTWDPFLLMVGALISNGVPVFFKTQGRPVGYAARRVLLNPNLQAAVAARDKAAVLKQINAAMDFMASQTCEKIEF